MKSNTGSVRVAGLTKLFHLYRHPRERLVEALSLGRLRRGDVFVALDGISFEVSPGRALGIVGVNGAGKSTLLKLIAGTLYPTSGSIEARGRMTALLEIGSGFHPDFTGRQNARLNARLLGLNEHEVDEVMAQIIDFADIGDFFDRPLRTYSSGMQMRLGFAVAIGARPDVLLIDEVLAVGDASFQAKCIERLHEFRRQGVTILLVSHDPAAIRALCDEAVLMHGGAIVGHGRPDEILERYNALLAAIAPSSAEESAARRFGTGEAVIDAVDVRDVRGNRTRALPVGSEAEFRVQVTFRSDIEKPTVGILLRDRLGGDVFGTNTHCQRIDTGRRRRGETAVFSFFIPLDLGPGHYAVSAAVHSGPTHVENCYEWVDGSVIFQVTDNGESTFVGPARLRPRIVVDFAHRLT